MIKISLGLVISLGLAASAVAAPSATGEDAWAEAAAASAAIARMNQAGRPALAAQDAPPAGGAGQVKHWEIASNDSNATEIYGILGAAESPTCADTALIVNGQSVNEKNCSVTARVERLTVTIDDIVRRSTEQVKVQGDASCQAEWRVVPQGRRQALQLWHFCQFSGVVEP
jgi:hypothetical protein